MIKEKTKNYLLVLLLLLFSGNPMVNIVLGKYTAVIGLFFVIILIQRNRNIGDKFYILIKQIAVFLFVITALQYLEFSFVSILGMFNMLIKFAKADLLFII